MITKFTLNRILYNSINYARVHCKPPLLSIRSPLTLQAAYSLKSKSLEPIDVSKTLALAQPIASDKEGGSRRGIGALAIALSLGAATYLVKKNQEVSSSQKQIAFSVSPSIKEVYGSKYEELVKLASFLEQEPIEGVRIPLPKGMHSSIVEKLLLERAPRVFIKWDELKQMFASCKDKEMFLQDAKVKKALSFIQQEIINVFIHLSTKDLEQIGQIDGLSSWLANLKKNGSYVMVRSTSPLEDKALLPNAGGNLSEEYVEPNLKAVLTSSGRVIASYFGSSSLRNQIESGYNPFENSLVLPVLFQELIGEPVGGAEDPKNIPISVVLFTSEPNDSEGEFKVIKICAAPGHGSGIVNYGKVESDRAHLIRSSLHPDEILEAYQNRHKLYRLAPMRDPITGKVTLQVVNNPLEIQKKRILGPHLIQRLTKLSEYLDRAYGEIPSDVEIVILQDNIYIVQRRDIARPTNTTFSYLSATKVQHLDKTPILQEIPVKVLVSSKASTLVIEDPKLILVEDSLGQAENISGSKTKSAIFVGTDEENTHPIVNFSSHGVTCVYSKNLGQMRSLAAKIDKNHPLVLCPQSGRVYLWDKTVADPKTCVEEGYFSHPAPLAFSLEAFPFEPIENVPVPSEIADLLHTLKTAKERKIAKKALDTLKDTFQTQVQKAKYSYERLYPKQGTAPMLDKIEKVASFALEELQANPPSHKHRLFLIKTLETLLQSQPAGSLYTYSIHDIKAFSEQAAQILEYRNALPAGQESHFESLLSKAKFFASIEGEKAWKQFLLGLEKIPFSPELAEKKKRIETLLDKAENYHAAELFINAFCYPKILTMTDPMQALDDILATVPILNDGFLKWCKEVQDKLRSLERSLSAFEDPATFASAWKELRETLYLFYKDRAFHPEEELAGIFPGGGAGHPIIHALSKGSPFTALIAIESMKEVIDVTDKAIKTVVKSASFSEKTKIAFVKEMVDVNAEMLAFWLTELPINMPRKYVEYMIQSTRILEDTIDTSEGFSVAGALSNSGASLYRHLPQTLGDRFTLVHQEEEVVIQELLLKHLPSIPKSPFLRKAIQEFAKLEVEFEDDYYGNFYARPFLDGVEIGQKGIVYHYYMSLRNHSARFALEQTKEGKLLFHGKLLGEDRSRWRNIHGYLQALDYAKGISLIEPAHLIEQEISFTWSLDTEAQVALAEKVFNAFLEYSCFEMTVGPPFFVNISRDSGLLSGMGKWYAQNGGSTPMAEEFIRAYRFIEFKK